LLRLYKGFLSSKLFKDSHSKEKIAILLTDGIDNASSVPLDLKIKPRKVPFAAQQCLH
jgi:Ca-activated chloride channel family protein